MGLNLLQEKLIMAAVIIYSAVAPFLPHLKRLGKNKAPFAYRIAASYTLTLGIISLFAIFLNAFGQLDGIVPSDFEWPALNQRDVIRTDNGLFIVPLNYPGRVQVYDRNKKYITGWNVLAGGGSFNLFYEGGDQIEVITNRLHKHYFFTLSGELIQEENYGSEKPPISEGSTVPFFTRGWLLPIAHPTIAFGVIFLSVFIISRGQKIGEAIEMEGLDKQPSRLPDSP